METNLKNEINFLIKPVAILTTTVILFVIVSLIGFKNLRAYVDKINENKATQKSLSQKVSTLETVSQILPGDITFLDIVLPNRGVVLYGLSQVKTQAIKFNLAISNLKTGGVSPESGGVLKASIGFEVTGNEKDIYNFLQSFNKLLPLMNVNRVNLTKVNDITNASITLNIYSAELPQKIPSVTGTVTELSQKDINLLGELTTYSLPQFVEPTVTNIPQKEDPFR